MKIGTLELVVIFIVALLVIGPNKLPEYARKLGQAMKEFKKVSEAVTKEIKENIVEPLDEVQKPLKEAVAPITEMEQEIRGSIKEVTDSVNGIGKPRKAEEAKAAPQPAAEETPAEEIPAEEPAQEPAVQAQDTSDKENPQ